MIEKDKKNCSGCTACMAVCPKRAITMHVDEEGFQYPSVDEKQCISCGLCEAVCPFQQQSEKKQQYPQAYAMKHHNDKIRHNSATAGIFTAVSDVILHRGGIIYGASYDENFIVRHSGAVSAEERDTMRGSKYTQSDMGDVYRQIKKELTEGREILFTGTPCQVAGLKSYIIQSSGKQADNLMENLVTCDIICHGTPSPLIFHEWIQYMEKAAKSKIKDICMRDKDMGWMSHAWKVSMQNGRQYRENIWIQYYKHWMYSHYILRPSCHHCVFTNLNRPGDITLGDFWNIDNVCPDMKDALGVASVLINSKKGEDILKQIEVNCEIKSIKTEDCLQEQLKESAKPAKDREAFWQCYAQKGLKGIIRNYSGLSTLGRIKRHMKDMLRDR